MQNMQIYEDWSSVVTKLYPVGYDGLMLPEEYIESDVQYTEPYTRTVSFESSLEIENATESELINELRSNANKYLEENKVPKVSYVVTAIVNERLEIGDTVHVKHPLCNILTEVLEYEYNIISQKMKSITFGNYSRDVKTKFDTIKESINTVVETLSKQEITIKHQTNLINSLNKNGFVYIDDNEILILDKLPKEEAENVWRFGLGGIGFSSNGYEGPFETAITMDGQINANFITTGTMSVSRIEGLENTLNNMLVAIELNSDNITSIVQNTMQVLSKVTGTNYLKLDNCAETTLKYFKINGPQQVYTLYPSTTLYPSPTLYPAGKSRTMRIIVDTQPRGQATENKKVYKFKISPYLGENDAIIIENGKLLIDRNGTITEQEDLEIELFEGTNYIYVLDETDLTLYAEYLIANELNKYYGTKVEIASQIKQEADRISLDVKENYASKAELTAGLELTTTEINLGINQKLTNYSTTEEMNAAINLKIGEINIELAKKVSDTDYTKASIILKLNDTSSQAKINADVIDLEASDVLNILAGNTINLSSENIAISSTNFSVDENGNITAKGGTIGGFTLSANAFEGEFSGIYKYSAYDLKTTQSIIMGYIYQNSSLLDLCDINDNGTVQSSDYVLIKNIVEGSGTNTKSVSGTISINSNDPKNNLTIKKGGTVVVTLGAGRNRI